MNIFFWTAFIIYDDFWDEDEAADPQLLPVANLFARSFVHFFDTLFPEHPEFTLLFHELMDDLDMANAWETRQCRARISESIFLIPKHLPFYGDYTNKYRPASGHIVGSIAILIMCGIKLESSEVRYLTLYFKYYLIAMQINDDMHDWEEDMKRGNISIVVDMLLRDLPKRKKTINLFSDIDLLRKIFWFTTLKTASKKSIANAQKSRRALYKVSSIEDFSYLEQFITATESIAIQGICKQKDSIDFLRSYSQK